VGKEELCEATLDCVSRGAMLSSWFMVEVNQVQVLGSR
jgi:hypothetical protein